MVIKKSTILWLTGMSGSGKTTLSSKIEIILQKQLYNVKILDGDEVRSQYKKKLSFNREDVMLNNLHIAQKCMDIREKYDVIIVPVISPYNETRIKVRNLLDPNFHLIYLKTDIGSLRARDPKGLYKSADNGLIKDLIGYSQSTPYEEPADAELTIDTSNQNSINDCARKLSEYIESYILT